MVSRHIARAHHIENSDTVALFIHGILGSPSQFSFMEHVAHERGISTVCLLLPGHGSTAKAFARSNTRQWKDYVSNELQKLNGQYSRVYLVGHSMGGLLALLELHKNPDCAKGVFCLALPLFAQISPKSMKMALLTVFGLERYDEYSTAAVNMRGVGKTSFFSYITWLPNLTRLLFFSREIRRALPSINTRARLLFSANDESVSRRSIAYAKRLPNARISVLPNSSHYIYSEQDKKTVLSSFEEFISE